MNKNPQQKLKRECNTIKPGLGPKFLPGSYDRARGRKARGGAIRPMLNFLEHSGLPPSQPYGQSGPEYNYQKKDITKFIQGNYAPSITKNTKNNQM